jgi:hypothetical protein
MDRIFLTKVYQQYGFDDEILTRCHNTRECAIESLLQQLGNCLSLHQKDPPTRTDILNEKVAGFSEQALVCLPEIGDASDESFHLSWTGTSTVQNERVLFTASVTEIGSVDALFARWN